MEETKKCPYCGKEILAVAKKCKHCGEWLDERNEQKNTIPCPACGEQVDDGIEVCPHCNERLTDKDVAPVVKSDEANAPMTNKKNTRPYVIGCIAILVIAAIYLGIRSSGKSPSEYIPEESSVAVAQPNDSIGTESYIQPPTTMTEDDPYDASNDVYDPWLGTLNIDGAVYRTADTKAMLTLEKNGTDTYKGRLIVLVGSQDMDTYRFVDTHGSLDGKVRAKSSGRELLVTLVESESYAGDETNLFDGVFNGNDQIFKIVYDGSSYTTTAIGKMEYFYDGANIYTTK